MLHFPTISHLFGRPESPPTISEPTFFIGCDLGQVSDPTAVAVLRRTLLATANGQPARDHRGRLRYQFEVLHLERYALLTSYPEIVTRVAKLVARKPIPVGTRLAVDATGVGRPVIDLFLDAKLPATVAPITLTGGDATRRDRWGQTGVFAWWVPKSEIVSITQALLQTERMKIAKALPLAATLRNELLNFKVKISAAAHESFSAREGAHDDILLAVSIAAWVGSQVDPNYTLGPAVEVISNPDDEDHPGDPDRPWTETDRQHELTRMRSMGSAAWHEQRRLEVQPRPQRKFYGQR